jgi:hypothetical protein
VFAPDHRLGEIEEALGVVGADAREQILSTWSITCSTGTGGARRILKRIIGMPTARLDACEKIGVRVTASRASRVVRSAQCDRSTTMPTWSMCAMML